MKTENILQDMEAMKYLQEERPVIFNLLQKLRYVPNKLLAPLLDDLIKKSRAPFDSYIMYEPINEETIEEHIEELFCFSQLHLCRNRGQYEADRVKSSRICTNIANIYIVL